MQLPAFSVSMRVEYAQADLFKANWCKDMCLQNI